MRLPEEIFAFPHAFFAKPQAAQTGNALKYLLIPIIALAGAGLTVQAATNSRMRLAVGSPTLGAAFSFTFSLLTVLALTATGIFGKANPGGAAGAPWWAWLGGFIGACYVTISIISVPRVGATVTFGSIIVGQLAAAVLIDTFGWLNVERVPLSPARALGVLLLLAGLALVQLGGGGRKTAAEPVLAAVTD